MLLETSGVNITTPNHLAAYFYFLLTYLEETVTKIHHYYLQRYYFFSSLANLYQAQAQNSSQKLKKKTQPQGDSLLPSRKTQGKKLNFKNFSLETVGVRPFTLFLSLI